MNRRDFFKKLLPNFSRKDEISYDERPERTGSDSVESHSNKMTRRDFLTSAGAGLIAGTVLGSIPNMPSLRNATEDKIIGEQLAAEIELKRRFIKDTYGLRVYVDYPKKAKKDLEEVTPAPATSPPEVTPATAASPPEITPPSPTTPDIPADSPFNDHSRSTDKPENEYTVTFIKTLSEQNRAMDLLIQELAYFPKGLLYRSLLQSIYVVARMEKISRENGSNGRVASVLLGAQTYISGGEKEGGRQLVLAVSGNSFDHNNFNGWVEGETRITFVHEMMHALDEMSDEEWASAASAGGTSAGLQYAKTEEDKRLFSSLGYSDKEWEGFKSMYGRTNIAEDRATVYELLSKGSSAELHNRIDDDTTLMRKLSKLASYMLDKSSGLMDGRYWESVWTGNLLPAMYFASAAKRIIATSYDDYVSDSKNFEAGGLRIVELPSREQYSKWQKQLWKDYHDIG